MLRFLEKVFPPLEKGMKVKVYDKRFKEGYFIGIIASIYSYRQPITSYGVRGDGRDDWHRVYAYRDHIEVLKD